MSKSSYIYFDNNATTPTDPRVIEAMLPYFYEKPGNASSRHHALGWAAAEAVEQSRQRIADLLRVAPEEIAFTSGATESVNTILKGIFDLYRPKGSHIITVTSEHSAVLNVCRRLEKMGAEVTYLDVDSDGLIDPEALEAAIRPDTVLVSVMWANNETGVIQPMEKIGEICEGRGVLLMSDATQAVGKIPVAPKAAGVHLMAFSAHKLYGPKGVGAFYISRRRPRVKLTPLLEGGGQENGLRSGTLNVPGIVGFGEAVELCAREMDNEAVRLSQMRDHLENTLLREVKETYLNGSRERRLPHVSNLSFRYVEGENLMTHCNRLIALSAGSACASASLEPSHVLQAMGMPDDLAHSAIRFSLGRFNRTEEIERALPLLIEGVGHLRSLSPAWELYRDGVDLDNIEWPSEAQR